MALDADTLQTLAAAADYMASESCAGDRGGRCSAYLRKAANAARAEADASKPSSADDR